MALPCSSERSSSPSVLVRISTTNASGVATAAANGNMFSTDLNLLIGLTNSWPDWSSLRLSLAAGSVGVETMILPRLMSILQIGGDTMV